MSTSHLDSVPPAKRRREDVESSPQHISRHNSLYFENGNIVLLSLPKDNVVTAFKVFKDFLLLCSPVFEGMLSLPPHPDVEKYDDVPLVRLPDEAEDLIPFLSAVYRPTDIPSRRDFYVAYDKVESVFKLSKKYQCDALCKCMKDKLLEIWPLYLFEWDRFVTNKKGREKREKYKQDGKEQSSDSDDPNHDLGEDNLSIYSDKSLDLQDHELNPVSMLPDPCSAIRLAREYDVPQILPAAYYHLFCILPGAFSDTDPGDGDHWGRSNSPLGVQANLTLLSPRDVMCCFRGSYAIRKYLNEFRGPDECFVHHRCRSALKSSAKKTMEYAVLHVDILETLRSSNFLGELARLVCEDCVEMYEGYIRGARRYVWSFLPQMFALYP